VRYDEAVAQIATQRIDQYLPLSQLRADLSDRFTLNPSDYVSGGPARYFDVKETGGRLGLHHAANPQFLRKLQ
jgi:cyclic pyranopterin phosphate synthase